MNLLTAAALALVLCAPAAAQEAKIVAQPGAPLIQQPEMLDLNLVEALVTIGAQDLAGVFGFIPRQASPAALADYLLHNRKALQRFIKKGERDLKETGGVNAWDKTVFMNVMQISGAGILPPGMDHLSNKEEYRVSALVLARGLNLQEMAAARGAPR